MIPRIHRPLHHHFQETSKDKYPPEIVSSFFGLSQPFPQMCPRGVAGPAEIGKADSCFTAFHSWQTSVLWGNGVWEQFRKSRWDFTCSASSTLLSILIVLLTSLKRKGVKLLWASSLLLEGAMSLEMWCWQRPRSWLCCHLIYWTMGEQLWCLPQNHCRNPELELSLNLRCPPCPLRGSCSCWQGILACHASFALCNFIHLFRKKGCFMGKHKMQVQKSFVISVKKHFLIKTLSVTILWIVLVLGLFITNTSSGGV